MRLFPLSIALLTLALAGGVEAQLLEEREESAGATDGRASPAAGASGSSGAAGAAGVIGGATPAGAEMAAAEGLATTPDPTAVCPLGRVSRIEIDPGPVFLATSADPLLLRWGYRIANLFHINTSAGFLRKELLFDEGDCFDPFLASESRLLLSRYRFLADVTLDVLPQPAAAGGVSGGGGAEGAVANGPMEEVPAAELVDRIIRLRTRDEWSTQVDVGVNYDDGINLERFALREQNFLGLGIRATFVHRQRREERTRSFSLDTPRFFGRSDLGVSAGNTRGGNFFQQNLTYRFLGEANRYSGAESYRRATEFFTYAAGGAHGYSHLFVPIRRERLELAGATRFGDPGNSIILGISFEHDRREVAGSAEIATGGGFDDRAPVEGELPADVLRQIADRGATRVALHMGARRYRHEERTGLDAVREVQLVSFGYFAGASLGRSFSAFLPEGVRRPEDYFARSHVSWGIPVGESILHGGITNEISFASGEWSNLVSELEMVAYGRHSRLLPNQTLFFRASLGGGWRSTLPLQLTLGGREGVRSLRDDAMPGGRRILLVAEDRIRVDWPKWSALDLGVTVFGDAGRVWPGDAPFGVDSGWMGSAGIGLRIAVPSGSHNVMRPEIVFPVGREGSPIFRMTFEVHRLLGGFVVPKLGRSRAFTRGPESF